MNETQQLIDAIIAAEWSQFQRTTNEGGRASCQGNWPMFREMRLSQFLTWPEPLLRSYLRDLETADRAGRNLVTEKYGRMMESTAPDEFRRNIAPFIPALDAGRICHQEAVIATQVSWAQDFRRRFPRLGAGMRVLTTAEDTAEATSFETYLRGELGTYSDATFTLYETLVANLEERGENLTEITVANTVRLAGFASLEEAEAAQ